MMPSELPVSLVIVEATGYLAATLVFLTFYMKTMLPLRYVAIGSNLGFIAYGALAGLNPILILHATLLPLNIYRLWQINKLITEVAEAAEEGFSIDWLLPYMNHCQMKAGEYLFRMDEHADSLFYVAKGTVELPEIGVQMVAGDMIGEIGLFSPKCRRTSSAYSSSDCELLTITAEKVLDLYFQNPRFGIYLIRLITGRLVREVEQLTRKGADSAKFETD